MSNNASVQQPKVDVRKTKINPFALVFNKLGIYVVVIGLILLGMLVSKGQFFASSNIQSILEAVALQGMVAAGLTFVVYSGNMNDMSLPMTMAFAGMMTSQFINLSFPVSALIGILTGVVIGLINGFMIGKRYSTVSKRFRQTNQMHRSEHSIRMERMKMKVCVT